MTMFTVVKSPELLVEAVLGLNGDGDDIRRLTVATPLEYQIGATTMAVVPGSLDEDAPAVGVAGFGNGSSTLTLAAGSFRGNQAKVGHKRSWRSKAPDIADLS